MPTGMSSNNDGGQNALSSNSAAETRSAFALPNRYFGGMYVAVPDVPDLLL
jgi:hypothetical protein